jgi:hypothetical protein
MGDSDADGIPQRERLRILLPVGLFVLGVGLAIRVGAPYRESLDVNKLLEGEADQLAASIAVVGASLAVPLILWATVRVPERRIRHGLQGAKPWPVKTRLAKRHLDYHVWYTNRVGANAAALADVLASDPDAHRRAELERKLDFEDFVWTFLQGLSIWFFVLAAVWAGLLARYGGVVLVALVPLGLSYAFYAAAIANFVEYTSLLQRIYCAWLRRQGDTAPCP